MATELDVLGIVSKRLSALGLAYMLTGSFAMAHYATPRMTRDIDLVVEIAERDVDTLVAAFDADFYVNGDAAREAIRAGTLFNLMHLASGITVKFILRQDSEDQAAAFARRQEVDFGGVRIMVAAEKDLSISNFVYPRRSAERSRNDNSDTVEALVVARHQAMSPMERMRAAAASFEVARAIVESSLPAGLSREARRLAVARRFYAGELPEAALLAHARFGAHDYAE